MNPSSQGLTDGSVRDAMRSALVKLTAVLPEDLKDHVERLQGAMEVNGRNTSAGVVPLSRSRLPQSRRSS